MKLTSQELREEQKRINKLRRQGWPGDIKGWIRGWRLVGQRLRERKHG